MVQHAVRFVASSPSVLIAEDDTATRALLRAVLERAGYAVRDVDNGADALAEIQREPPDVALLDIGMPEMDGLEVTRAVRAAPATALLPIILVTARGRLEDKVAGLDAGASDFITKPFEPAELLARVRSNLRLSTALTRLENTRDVLVALASAIDAKDPMTEHHCDRVAERAIAPGARPRPERGRDRGDRLRRGPPRRRQDRHRRGGADEAGQADRRGARRDAAPPDHRRRHPAAAAPGRMIGPIVRGHHERWDGERLPGRPARRGDPDRRAHRGGRGCL